MCSPGVTSFRLSQHLPPMIQKSGKCLQSWTAAWGWRRGCVFQGSQVAPLEAAKGMHVGICHTPEFRLWPCQTLSLWLWAGSSLSEPCSSSLFVSEQGTRSDGAPTRHFSHTSPHPLGIWRSPAVQTTLLLAPSILQGDLLDNVLIMGPPLGTMRCVSRLPGGVGRHTWWPRPKRTANRGPLRPEWGREPITGAKIKQARSWFRAAGMGYM